MVFGNDNPLKDIYGVEDILSPEVEKSASQTSIQPGCGIIKAQNVADKDRVMDTLRSELEFCQKCRLGASRKNLVFGEGCLNAELMFVGEGPGADEDASGRPFVGRSGQLLTKMIEAMGLQRSKVYIANIVKCRPPENRNPFADEADACIGNLKKQITIINPKYIVSLGSVAVSYLLGISEPISRLRGNWQEFCGYKVMPTFHPSYLLRSPNKKVEAWQDLQQVMKLMGLEIKSKA